MDLVRFFNARVGPSAGFLAVVIAFSVSASAQVNGNSGSGEGTAKTTSVKPLREIKQIDELGLRSVLNPDGKPLLINFWATWCDPCREEFPDLVKLDSEYRGKIDFRTVSLDDVEEINRAVPKFLSSMKAPMPTFLLKTEDDQIAIKAVAKDWNGGLPFTILYNPDGSIAYFRQGPINLDIIRPEINKVIPESR